MKTMVRTKKQSKNEWNSWLLFKKNTVLVWDWLIVINLLLTEREDRTGEYWPEVVAVRTERSEVRTKRPRANIPRYGSS